MPANSLISDESAEMMLKPSLLLGLWHIAFSALMVAAGISLVLHPHHPSDVWFGYFALALFGSFVLVFLLEFAPGSTFLRLSPDGFEVRSLWRSRSYKWSDIDRFGPAAITMTYRGIPMRCWRVGFRLHRSSNKKHVYGAIRKVNEKLCGYEAMLPDNYGMRAPKLAALLNKRREGAADAG